MREEIQRWFGEYRERLFIVVGILLVGILSFEAGLLQGKVTKNTPLILSLPAPNNQYEEGVATILVPPKTTAIGSPVVSKDSDAKCLFVGSKNSNKYHLPTCTVAKRIKPENKVCFASKEEAAAKGYLPSCIK